MKLQEVPKDKRISKERFKEQYLDPMEPVVIQDLTEEWPARSKWTIDYLKENYGDIKVPIVSKKFNKGGEGYMKPEKHVPFKEYLEMLEAGPTEYRMFLYNIFQHIPEMREDYSLPSIMDGFIDSFPFMFFGGQGSVTPLHYDIDLSHVFLNQIHGRKRVVLFSQDQSDLLYRQPYTVASRIDINNPDYDKFPGLKHLEGYETILGPGESLFMPSGYWHYIEYVDSGYSLSLRANDSIIRRAQGLINISRHFVVDKGMNYLMGDRWNDIKESMAVKNANKVLETIE